MAGSTHREFHQALGELRQRASHLLDEFYDKIGRHHEAVSGHVVQPARLPADVSDSEAGFEVSIEVPGMNEKDLEVTIEGDRLVVRGEKKDESEKRTKRSYFRERYYGMVQRAFWLSPDLDSDKARATYKNGVLTIAIPRKKGAKAAARRISVGAKR